MTDDDADAAEQDAGIPASMSDLFFTLIAVVVLMLLALLPAIRTPGALAPERLAPWRADFGVENRKPLVLAAVGDGLRFGGDGGERAVPLAQIFSDEGLKSALREAAANGAPPLLFVAADGGEAVFLLDALAASLGVGTLDQVRIDRACRFVAIPEARRFCDADGWGNAS